MIVEDSFLTKEAGLVVSGINEQFNSMDEEEIKQLIGDKVRIVIKEGQEIDADVKDIAISESLIGKKNISIALGDIPDVVRGSKLYKINNN